MSITENQADKFGTVYNIQALGNLLSTYYSDLIYIRDFHRYKNGKITTLDYLEKSTGTFKSFIDGFRVARNIKKDNTDKILELTIEWISTINSNDVDSFAEFLKEKGPTHGKLMTSLASKILFLNDPWTILPLDNLAKKAVGCKNNFYSQYRPLTQEFIKKNNVFIDYCLSSVNQHLNVIESLFKNEIYNIEKIRYNRFIDKILWTIGGL